MQMMSLGGFVFALGKGTAFEGLNRVTDGGWTTLPRYGQKPLSQNTGQALETISINGTWFKADGMVSIQKLRELQAKREPAVMTDGYGNNLGRWTIKRVNEKRSRVIDDGTAMVVQFSVDLEEYADGNDH